MLFSLLLTWLIVVIAILFVVWKIIIYGHLQSPVKGRSNLYYMNTASSTNYAVITLFVNVLYPTGRYASLNANQVYLQEKKWIVHIVNKECIYIMHNNMSWAKIPWAPFTKMDKLAPSMDK